MRFLKASKENVTRFLSAHSVSMGGISIYLNPDYVILYAPRIPPLEITCKDPNLVGMTILHFVAGVEGLPGVHSNDTQMEILDLDELAMLPKSSAAPMEGVVVPA